MTRRRADDAGPDETIYGPSKLVESVLTLLEAAGVPTDINDQVVQLIEQWEYQSSYYKEPDIDDGGFNEVDGIKQDERDKIRGVDDE